MGEPVIEVPSAAEQQKSIQRHRKCQASLTVSDRAGRPLAGQRVTVRQVRHKFLFGCNAYVLGRWPSAELEQEYRRRFTDLLNFATLPFYWGGYEKEEGVLDEARVAGMAQWCREQNIVAKGHPLCWHEVTCKWLVGKPPELVFRKQLERVRREVSRFVGLIDMWDVLNEGAVMPNYTWGAPDNPIVPMARAIGVPELVRQVFAEARQAGPKATLVLNDYNWGPEFQAIVESALAHNVPVDVIGLQSHMHKGRLTNEHFWNGCQTYSRLGLPVHFTEFTLLSGALKTDNDWNSVRPGWDSTKEGEERQAQEVAEIYTLLFAHPGVHAITWWDFSDAFAWQGAPSGLVRKDLSPKPAYEALMRLVKHDWWTGTMELTTDAQGKVAFGGFLGDYEVAVGGAKAAFTLGAAGAAAVNVAVG